MSSPQKKEIPPPCSAWGAWIGGEVEGHTDIGAKTLFIRRLSHSLAYYFSYAHAPHNIKRIWFCKEFTDWPKMRSFIPVFPQRVLEVGRENYHAVPHDIRDKFQFYFKVPYVLRPGDHVCVGPAFGDESFVIGTGRTVSPADYLADVRIGE